MHPRRRLAASLATSLTALALVVGGPAAAAPVEETPVKPAALDRGPSPSVPQVLGTTIIDGERRIDVPAQELWLLGASGDDYVVMSYGRHQSRVLRVTEDGERSTLLTRPAGELTLSGDGQQLFQTVLRDERSVLKVTDAETGEQVARRAFRGYAWVLDADEGRAVIGASSPSRTFRWNTATDATKRISEREGYFADIAADRLAVLTGDPYDGGCSVLAPLSAPRDTLWRSCEHAVVEASPNGQRLVTMLILADGPNSVLRLHRDDGRLLARYRTGPGWFGPATFEDGRTLLMQVTGPRRSAIVRCVLDECERATRMVRTGG